MFAFFGDRCERELLTVTLQGLPAKWPGTRVPSNTPYEQSSMRLFLLRI